jgi:NAD(P)-dependent dehydrogenase (short-subunit alcohol dehydrogenase family)
MKTALITGGSKGIGYGIAEAMVKENYRVAITGRNETVLNKAVEGLKGKGGEVFGVVCDVRDFSAQQDVVEQVIGKWNSLDILVANAGVGNFAPIDEMTIDQWQETIDINLTGVFYSIKATVDALKKSKGYIITISSLAGTNFFPTAAAYNASKFGLTGFTQAVMLDLRKYGIKVSTIMPGSVATDFAGSSSKSSESWKIQIEDIGQMVVDMLRLNPRTLPSKIEVRPSLPVKG